MAQQEGASKRHHFALVNSAPMLEAPCRAACHRDEQLEGCEIQLLTYEVHSPTLDFLFKTPVITNVNEYINELMNFSFHFTIYF